MLEFLYWTRHIINYFSVEVGGGDYQQQQDGEHKFSAPVSSKLLHDSDLPLHPFLMHAGLGDYLSVRNVTKTVKFD
jgi:hypothetical protein